MKNKLIHISAKSRADPSKHVDLYYNNVKEAMNANPQLYDFRAVGYVMYPQKKVVLKNDDN